MSSVLYEIHESHVAVVTLNRPERRNAIDDSITAGLSDALRRAEQDADVRVVVLTGAGEGFCAGADLAQLGAVDDPRLVHDHLVGVYKPLIEQFVALPKPIIAAINGFAAGAGASLALACDLRVMAQDAALMQAFSNIGLVPDAGATWFLARQLGYSRAFEIAIEGKPLHAETCVELGLTNRIVAPENLLDYTKNWAVELAARPPIAMALTKKIAHRAMQASLGEIMELEAAYQAVAVGTEDHAEGVAAFLERRRPKFQGK